LKKLLGFGADRFAAGGRRKIMDEKILVAYASKYGSTAEMARAVGKEIQAAGQPVEVKSVEEVDDPGAFAAVVLGSAVYAGQWRKEAGQFLLDHEDELKNLPVWLFSSGPTGEGDPAELMGGWTFPENLQPAAERIQPEDIKFFHGVLDESKLGFAEKLIVRALKAPLGDYRDWDAVQTWAGSIARVMEKTKAI
jgi:menaquinone-dependent protoporphyrinogen oxidase